MLRREDRAARGLGRVANERNRTEEVRGVHDHDAVRVTTRAPSEKATRRACYAWRDLPEKGSRSRIPRSAHFTALTVARRTPAHKTYTEEQKEHSDTLHLRSDEPRLFKTEAGRRRMTHKHDYVL
ncbi:hypothetical protein EVAR_34543_1 [Eumeta japonica]|uniref:Uncharacterized protein n=1 Tax=Eumeta variegata TaxID=151549 RepID=A0A4C1X498_EUMVA|nr:hypothetical protein EVAR_34543_1 [Eumeta japonica]